MNHANISLVKKYLMDMSEEQLWDFIFSYFLNKSIKIVKVHGIREHGIDLVARIDKEPWIASNGFYICIQAKVGKVTLADWRKNLLYQLLEVPYYPINQAGFIADLPRRIFLIVNNEITDEARASIIAWNEKHDLKVEYLDINGILETINQDGYIWEILAQIEKVGDAIEDEITGIKSVGEDVGEKEIEPPEVGGRE